MYRGTSNHTLCDSHAIILKADIRETDIKLFPYTIDKPLPVHACFNAKITAGDNSTTADFIIISDKGQPSLLGLTTAHLGVFKIGINLDVNKVNQCKYASLLENYSDLFSGIGKYPTKVIADALPVGLGAVLVQIQEDGPRIISYDSRSLTDVEQRHCQTEREALSLVWDCEKSKAYLLGIRFDLVKDHEPLKTIYGPKSKPCARIKRWVLRLML